MAGNFAKVQTTDRVTNQIQENITRALASVVASPLIDGVLVTNVALVVGSNVINHKLGRKLTGWFLTRTRSAATVYDTQDSNLTPDKTLQLTASGVVTVDVFCF